MSKKELARAIQRELDVLNKIIDKKILRGVSYVNEARRHRQLLSRLVNLNKHTSYNMFGRISSIFSFS